MRRLYRLFRRALAIRRENSGAGRSGDRHQASTIWPSCTLINGPIQRSRTAVQAGDIEIHEKVQGPEHPDTAIQPEQSVAGPYRARDRLRRKPRRCARRALAICGRRSLRARSARIPPPASTISPSCYRRSQAATMQKPSPCTGGRWWSREKALGPGASRELQTAYTV